MDIHDFIRSRDTNIDPHDGTKTIPIWQTNIEKQRFLLHPNLYPKKLHDYQSMLKKLEMTPENQLSLSFVEYLQFRRHDFLFLFRPTWFIALMCQPLVFRKFYRSDHLIVAHSSL